MRIVMVCAAALAAAGCANLNTAFRSTRLDTGQSVFIDAEQRAILSSERYDQRVLCAEPGPDVFAADSGAFSGNASGGEASGGFAASSGQSVGAISAPTTAILAQRHAYFRICEAYMNGASDEIDVLLGIRNNQRSLAGIIAIEQLTGAVRPPATVLSASGSSSSGQLLSQLSSSRQIEVARRAEAQARLDDQTRQQTTLNTRRGEIEAEQSQPNLSDDVKARLRAQLEATNRQLASLETTMADTRATIAASTNIIQSLDTAIAAAREGGAATTATGIVINTDSSTIDGETAETLAAAVVRIVETMNADDYGPTECLASLRRGTTASPAAEPCRVILARYTEGLEANVALQSALAAAAQHVVQEARRENRALNTEELQFLLSVSGGRLPAIYGNQ
jgi:hypothetical protein